MRALGDEIEVASVIRALRDAQDSIDRLGLEPKVRRLVRIRTSQINGCEPCIRLNVDAAASEDETRLRIDGLAAWRSMEAYLPDERAALAWCEALTRPSRLQCSELSELKANLVRHFSRNDIIALTMETAMVDHWNKIALVQGR